MNRKRKERIAARLKALAMTVLLPASGNTVGTDVSVPYGRNGYGIKPTTD